MKKKRIGIIALMLSSALIISASATISTVFKCSAAGIDYQAYSTLNTSSTAPNKLAGGGTVATVSKNTVPAGYMMIKSTIMTSKGEVVGSSSWTQNTQYANNLVSHISYASYGTGTYYGQALLKLYEGGEYKPLTVTRTPSMAKLTRSSMANNNQETQDKDAIFVNENGYTMGNATTEDSSEIRDLDFYSAIGVNGKKGYIRASEMNGPKTLDEAATYDDSSKDIPVYASDGVTVIDTFHIYGPEESSSTDTMVAATSLTE